VVRGGERWLVESCEQWTTGPVTNACVAIERDDVYLIDGLRQ
jgi:hypothetical protein